MNVKQKRMMVVGMGVSGIACTDLLLDEGAIVIINDSVDESSFPDLRARYEEEAKEGRLIFALAQNPEDFYDDLGCIVLSPGVPLTAPFAQRAQEQGIEVIGEIELGYRFSQAPIIAITGTNGKTTTTALTGELFRAGGKNTYVLGNIGIPIVELARETTKEDVIVAEVAGFQLESIRFFHSPCCAFLNISEDHLNRFGTMEAYIDSKKRMFENQVAGDILVLNADDPVVSQLGSTTPAKKLFFSRKKEVEDGAYEQAGVIFYVENGKKQKVCETAELQIPGGHNVENAMASICLAMSQGIRVEDVARGLRAFAGVEHRIEFVKEIDGIRYINDSKGTNPDSTIKAIEAMDRPTILLLGGSNKNSDYVPVFQSFQGRIKAVVALGETKDQILRDAKKTKYDAIYLCDGTLEEAIYLAKSLAEDGDNILLSPACASYDMFTNFEERGHVFKEIINGIEK